MIEAAEKCRKVLVVDDERVIADTLGLILAQQGYETRTAYSGEEAIRVAASFRPNVLVSDIKMPGIDGVTAAEAIVASLPGCCVLLISGHISTGLLSDDRIQRLGFQLAAKPAAPQLVLAKVAALLAWQRRITVVNVDDAEIPRYAVTHMLEHAGFQVKEAATGAEALSLAKTRPDVILLDVHLPDMSGFDVCRQLRAWPETAKIPIVHLTNTCRDEGFRQLALSLGANEYLTQPVEPEPLINLLRKLANPSGTICLS